LIQNDGIKFWRRCRGDGVILFALFLVYFSCLKELWFLETVAYIFLLDLLVHRLEEDFERKT